MNNPQRNQWWIIVLVVISFVVMATCVCLHQYCSIPDRTLLIGSSSGIQRWHDITPGKTSQEEALNVLRSSSYVRQASIEVPPSGHYGFGTETKETQNIYWDNRLIYPSPTAGHLSNRMIIVDDQVEVVSIRLDYDITVNQIVTHFGKPDKIVWDKREDSGVYMAAYLLYPSQGLAIHCLGFSTIVNGTMTGTLLPDSRVLWVYYFEPMQLDEFADTIGPLLYMDLSQIGDWTGYGLAQSP
jgi:hypothetical protein